MKDILRQLVVVATLTLVFQINAAQWEPLGPQGGAVFSLVRSPDDPRIVYAGTNFGGLYHSADSGLSWEHIETVFSNKVVFVVELDPNNSDTLYAGTFETGIFKSTDAGTTWTDISHDIADLNITAIAVSPINSNHLIIGTGIGAYHSIDGGASWMFATGLPAGQVRAAVWDPLVAGLAYAGTTTEGVFRSIDGGVTWSKFDTGMGARTITDIAIDTDDETRLFACTSNGIFTRKDADSQWADISNQIAEVACNQILPLKNSAIVMAATAEAIYRIDDLAQTTWESVSPINSRSILANDDLSLFHVAASASTLLATEDFITFYPSDKGMQNRFAGTLATVPVATETLIYSGTDVGVEFTSEFFAQADGSLPWIPGFQFDGAIFGITPNPSRSENIFIGTERGGVWQTNDYGFNWQPSSNGMVPEQIFDLATVPTAAGKLYAATSSGLFISDNDGASWAPDSNTAISFPIATVASDPERPGVAFYGTFSGDVLRTLDGNQFSVTWRHPNGAAIKEIIPSRWHNIYLITESGELYASDDVGKVFIRRAEQDITEQVQAVAVDPEEPWVVYAGTVFGGVYKSETNGIEWSQMNRGLDLPIVTAIAIDANNTNIIYAGGLGVIYRSVDSGDSWVAKTAGLPDQLVQNLTVDQANPSTVYATLENNGLYGSTDSGETWVQLQAGSAFLQETAIIMSEANPGRLFAGTQLFGMQVSSDGGQTFVPSSAGMTPFVRTVAMSRFAEVMYAGSLSAGVFKSTDEADNWQPTGLSDRNVFNVTIDPNNTETVFVGTSLGVSRSVDGAQTWEDLGTRAAYVFDVAIDPDTPGQLYASGLAGQVYASSNYGNTWSDLPNLPAGNVVSLAFSANANLLFAAVQDIGVFRYSFASSKWQGLAEASASGTRPLDLLIDQSSGALLLATNGDGIYRSSDNGDSWVEASTGLSSTVVSQLAIDPQNANVLYSASLSDDESGSGVHRSIDGGQTWSALPITVPSVVAISVSPHVQSKLYAVADDGLVWHSSDSGDSWVQLDGGLAGVSVLAVKEDPFIQDRLLAITSADAGIFTSEDGGQNWVAPNNPAEGNNVNMMFGSEFGQVYVANLGSGLLRSFNSGISFDDGHNSGLRDVPVLFLAIDPNNSQRLFAATGGIGVLRSLDGGLTWKQVLTDAPLFLSVVIDSNDPLRVYAGSAEFGVFMSQDGGESWVQFNDGLFNKTVTALSIDPINSNIIYAGTEGGGVFRRNTGAP